MDGFTAKFFQSGWEFLQDDLLEAVHDYFQGAILPVGIPKKLSLEDWSDYRPVSLCNYTHKIISKIHNERLANILPLLITENQSGFLKGRLISDNILLMQELTLALDSKTRESNVILKIDMQKAYEKLNWGFLANMFLVC